MLHVLLLAVLVTTGIFGQSKLEEGDQIVSGARWPPRR